MFDIVPESAIEQGRATDAYFLRTEEALTHAGRNPHVVAEVTADQFPTGELELFAGLADAAKLLEGHGLDADAIPEGTLFDGGPVMRIEGPYLEFARLETSLLGFLSHPSAMATAALEARRAAPETSLLSFGARHVHPSIAGMVDRSALLAGFDGFSHVAAGDLIDREASGTMPHALMICFGPNNQEDAWRAFDEAVDPDVPRIALCDTYDDEVDEAVRAAELGFDSVRLDTTGSRRGDFRHIIRETRWKLDVNGHEDVDIFVSGGITRRQSDGSRMWPTASASEAISRTPSRSISRSISSRSTANRPQNAGNSPERRKYTGRPTAVTMSLWPIATAPRRARRCSSR